MEQEKKQPDVRLIGLDLDGTTLTSDKVLTPHTKEVLEKCLAEGIQVLPATGRVKSGIPEYLTQIEGMRYVILSNGASVLDLKAVLIISLLSVCFFLYFGDRVVKAQESANDIQYKVVEIKDGDSLWSIAKENMDNTNDSGFINIYQYIHEIKRCNNMKSNQVNAGCYLMVPYYN